MKPSSEAESRPVDPAALRSLLDRIALAGGTRTYQQAAQELGLEPPQTIHRLIVALEQCMTEDAEAGRPLRAALVVSRTRGGLPAPGFFAHARGLGVYSGPDTGPEAAAFHAAELERVHRRHGPDG